MNKPAARNVLVIVGAWSLSEILVWAIQVLLIPIDNRLTYSGDSGVVIMWLWSAVPATLMAAAAAIAVTRLLETRRSWSWLGGLIALYLYSGVLKALRLRSGFSSPSSTPDDVGITIAGITPAVACGIAALWIARRRSPAASSRS